MANGHRVIWPFVERLTFRKERIQQKVSLCHYCEHARIERNSKTIDIYNFIYIFKGTSKKFDMESVLNDFELRPPPLLTIQILDAQFAEQILPKFDEFLCNKALHSEFEQSAALLGRLMARRKNSFRKMSGFKSICKLNTALCRLLRLDLPRVLDDFRGTLPDIVVDHTTKTEVPTRNSFDYVLVRLINGFRIQQRINECCKVAGAYIVKIMGTNFFMEINTFFLAVIAKIKKQSMIMESNCANLYNQLFPFRQSFPQNKNNEFLPKCMELPNHLSPKTLKPSELDELFSSNNQVEPKVTLLATKSKSYSVTKKNKFADMGKAISRETVNPIFDVEQLNTLEAVNKFILEENKARKSSPNSCLTKEILIHEWKGALKIFERKILSDEQRKALLLFQKFLKSKI